MRASHLCGLLLATLTLVSCAGTAELPSSNQHLEGVYSGWHEDLFGLGKAHLSFGIDPNGADVDGGVRVVLVESDRIEKLKEKHDLTVHPNGTVNGTVPLGGSLGHVSITGTISQKVFHYRLTCRKGTAEGDAPYFGPIPGATRQPTWNGDYTGYFWSAVFPQQNISFTCSDPHSDGCGGVEFKVTNPNLPGVDPTEVAQDENADDSGGAAFIVWNNAYTKVEYSEAVPAGFAYHVVYPFSADFATLDGPHR